MLPKTGGNYPYGRRPRRRGNYARTIAELLRKEHGDSRRAIKQLMRQTDASERTVKHWLAGQHGPDTVYFLRLVVSSPVIRAFVLGLIERPAASPSTDLVDRISLVRARGSLCGWRGCWRMASNGCSQNVPERVPERDPINDPDRAALNERQRWFLDRVAEGRCGANESRRSGR